MNNLQRATFLFKFNEQSKAEKFLNRVNKETEGWAKNLIKGQRITIDKRTVLVRGTGSNIFDMILKNQCEEFCAKLNDGCLVE